MNFLLIGKPGWGKTTAACTAPKPLALIDVDGKAREMVNIRPNIEKEEIKILDITSRLFEGRLSDRARYPTNPTKAISKEPQGYYEIVDLMNDFIDGKDPFDYFIKHRGTVVLDTITRAIDHMKRLLIYQRGKKMFGKINENSAEDMNWPSWGTYLTNLEELFYNVCKYAPCHFVATVHEYEKVERDPITEVEVIKGYWPTVQGQMQSKIVGYFNEAYFMHHEMPRNKPPIYRFRTSGGKYCARTSLDLPEFAEPNITKILKKADLL